jgi:hypothetical protein
MSRRTRRLNRQRVEIPKNATNLNLQSALALWSGAGDLQRSVKK